MIVSAAAGGLRVALLNHRSLTSLAMCGFLLR